VGRDAIGAQRVQCFWRRHGSSVGLLGLVAGGNRAWDSRLHLGPMSQLAKQVRSSIPPYFAANGNAAGRSGKASRLVRCAQMSSVVLGPTIADQPVEFGIKLRVDGRGCLVQEQPVGFCRRRTRNSEALAVAGDSLRSQWYPRQEGRLFVEWHRL